MGHFDLRHTTMLGLVKIKKKEKKNNQKHTNKQTNKSQFKDIEAVECHYNSDKSDDDLSNTSDDSDINEGDINDLLDKEMISNSKKRKYEHNDHSYSLQKRKSFTSDKYQFEMLYAVTYPGKTSKIKNCISKAVAILSNSKALFLGHIKTLLDCLDPRFAELCYVDTDSCLFSMTFPTLEQCLLPHKKDEFFFKDIIANESGPLSCHGKMKCEGIYTGGKFRSLKVYRLYNNIRDTSTISHCKGVNTFTAISLPENMFNINHQDPIFVTKHSLRPTRTGEMLIIKESKNLAIPFNLKRFVCNDSVHSLPLNFVLSE